MKPVNFPYYIEMKVQVAADIYTDNCEIAGITFWKGDKEITTIEELREHILDDNEESMITEALETEE